MDLTCANNNASMLLQGMLCSTSNLIKQQITSTSINTSLYNVGDMFVCSGPTIASPSDVTNPDRSLMSQRVT